MGVIKSSHNQNSEKNYEAKIKMLFFVDFNANLLTVSGSNPPWALIF